MNLKLCSPIHTFMYITLYFKIHVALHVFQTKSYTVASHTFRNGESLQKRKLINMPNEEIFQNQFPNELSTYAATF